MLTEQSSRFPVSVWAHWLGSGKRIGCSRRRWLDHRNHQRGKRGLAIAEVAVESQHVLGCRAPGTVSMRFLDRVGRAFSLCEGREEEVARDASESGSIAEGMRDADNRAFSTEQAVTAVACMYIHKVHPPSDTYMYMCSMGLAGCGSRSTEHLRLLVKLGDGS